MVASSFDIAVVGSGIPGLAAALGFAQQGLSVALIGPRAKPYVPTRSAPYDPRIYAMAPSSVALLEGLGVWASVDQQRVCAVEHMRVFGDDGPQLAFDAYGATVERLATIVEEGELLRVLDAACGFQPSIKRISSSFTSLAAKADVIDVAARRRIDCGEAADRCRRCELFGACCCRTQCDREVIRSNGHRCELRMRTPSSEHRVAMVYR